MRIKLFDVQVNAYEDDKQVWPPPRPAAPLPAPLSAAARWLLGFALAALVVTATAFMAWWDGYIL